MNKLTSFFGIIVLLLVLSYFANIVKIFTNCDFHPDTSWKCEVVRTIGVFVPPVGAVTGFLTFDGEKD